METINSPFQLYDNQKKIFDLSHGFLPADDPLQELPDSLQPWDQIAKQLPKLLVSNQLFNHIQTLPPFNLSDLKNMAQFERAMLILSYLTHAYIWGSKHPPTYIPAILAVPWYEVAKKLERPPILSYASYALYNWQRINTQKPIELGNIALIQNFLGGLDEEWFILVHVEIEAVAAKGLAAIIPAQKNATQENLNELWQNLQQIKTSLMKMCSVLDRMPECCDPYIYYRRVRPYIHGWKNNPVFPQGLIYEGVQEYKNQPQQFKGETGAQSTIIPSFDAALGIKHEEDILKAHLDEMRDYMPAQHLKFLTYIESGPSIRDVIKQHAAKKTELKELYNECLKLLSRFRNTHLKYAAHYIQKQAQTSDANPTEIGTGGTPFMNYLREHFDTTEKFLLK